MHPIALAFTLPTMWDAEHLSCSDDSPDGDSTKPCNGTLSRCVYICCSNFTHTIWIEPQRRGIGDRTTLTTSAEHVSEDVGQAPPCGCSTLLPHRTQNHWCIRSCT